MREFTAEYLEDTRTGMWDDSREALEPIGLPSAERILDVGAGTGALTRILRDETAGEVFAIDVDGDLLQRVEPPRIRGSATRLPFPDGTFDVVVCQALLVNMPVPEVVVDEFARVSRDRVVAIEPNNSAVSIESTVEAESALARTARRMYLDGVETDASLGAVRDLFSRAGLTDVEVRRYDHHRTIEPPYGEYALRSAKQRASGEGLERDRDTILAGDVTPEEYDRLREAWREMGRSVIEQIQTETYRQQEVVPFFVTVGRVD